MTERRGDTLLFHTPPVIAAQAAVGGKKESDGPLAAGFDELTTDNRLGQCSWEPPKSSCSCGRHGSACKRRLCPQSG